MNIIFNIFIFLFGTVAVLCLILENTTPLSTIVGYVSFCAAAAINYERIEWQERRAIRAAADIDRPE